MNLPPDDPLAGFFSGRGLKRIQLKTAPGPVVEASSNRR